MVGYIGASPSRRLSYSTYSVGRDPRDNTDNDKKVCLSKSRASLHVLLVTELLIGVLVGIAWYSAAARELAIVIRVLTREELPNNQCPLFTQGCYVQTRKS